MFTNKFVMKTLVPALLIGAAGAVSAPTAHASNPGSQSCVFEKYAPVSVTPYSADENVTYGTYSFLRGAQLYVPAREGLTKEWLEASVQQALASQTQNSSNNDPACQSPNVKNVRVTVSSAGNGFWVTLIGRDERSANALLKWANSIVDQHKQPARTAAAAH
jgi:hypothetical protein